MNDPVVERITSILLRYFRKGEKLAPSGGGARLDRDREMLALHWAFSQPLADFADYVDSHRHEVRAFLSSEERIDDGIVRGRLDSVATERLRLVRGNPSLVVSRVPTRSFDSQPNHVVLWVLEHAWRLTRYLRASLPDGAPQGPRLEKLSHQLDRLRRVDPMRAARIDVDLRVRPGPQAVVQAKRSRNRIYQHAGQALSSLLRLEAGVADEIGAVVRDTVVGPLEAWRRFELCVLLATAEAFEEATGSRIHLNLVGNEKEPLARVGKFAFFWQLRTSLFEAPPPEPSEVLLHSALLGLGFGAGSDRPDILVVDEAKDEVLAVVEVKHFGDQADDGDALRSAVDQIVTYSRGYRVPVDVPKLIEASAIALWRDRRTSRGSQESAGVPFVVDFESLDSGLRTWAKRRIAAKPKAA